MLKEKKEERCMRKQWLNKAASACVAVSMALAPAAQAMASEETMVSERVEETETQEESTMELSAEEMTTQEKEETIPESSAVDELVTTQEPTSQESQSEDIAQTSEKSEESQEVLETEFETRETESEAVETEATEFESVSLEEVETESEKSETVEFETVQEDIYEEDAIYESEGYRYKLIDGCAVITEYVGTEENVVIPSKLNGYVVTEIGKRAFSNASIKSVQIPSSVTTIGERAFAWSVLESIVIPSTVKTLEDGVFWGCKNLKTAKIESSADIVNDLFFACETLETVEITGKPTAIGDSAFGKAAIKTFEIPSSVTTIGYSAFNESGLESIVIPSTVITLGEHAFANCANLKYAKIETSSDIKNSAFAACPMLETVEITGKPTRICDSAFNTTGLTSFVIPSSVNVIEEFAFAGAKFEQITIPASVQEYGKSVFYSCKELTSVRIESNADITEKMFLDCSALKTLEITGRPTSIGDYAFYGTNLVNVSLPDSVITIGYGNPLKSSADNFIYQITNGKAVVYGYSGDHTEASIPSKIEGCPVTKIESFRNGEKLTKLTIPSSVEEYTEGAFSSCKSLVTVQIQSSADIPENLFKGCKKLTTVEFLGSPTSIGAYAFFGANLRTVKIPDSVTKIGYAAITQLDESGNYLYAVADKKEAILFGYRGNEKEVVLPAKLDGYQLTRFAAIDNNAVEKMTIPASITAYERDGGNSYGNAAAFDFDQSGLKYLKIKSAAEILPFMFYNCKLLESVELTGKVSVIGHHAFTNTGLKKIDIPASVTKIGNYAFCNTKLERVVVPSTVQTLDMEIFAGCDALKSVVLECPVVSSYSMFYGCENLKIEIAPTVTELYGGWLNGAKNVTLYVTAGTPGAEGIEDYVEWGHSYVIMDKNYTGLQHMGNNVWYYKVNGINQWNYTGLVKHSGSWYYVEKGVLNWNYTGLTNYGGTWYYVDKGVLNWKYTGLTQYYGTWYYVEKGVLNWKYTGLTQYYGTWYYVDKGVLNWNYTGLTQYYGTWYYVQKGILNWNYTGYVWHNRTRCYVKNGVWVQK